MTHQFESALRLLNDRVHVYQYFVQEQANRLCRHRPVARGSGVVSETIGLLERTAIAAVHSQYLVLLLEHDRFSGVHRSFRQLCATPIAAIRERLSVRDTVTLLEAQLERSVRSLDQLASSVAVQLADCSLRKLPKQDAFSFLRRLINFDAHVVDASHLRYDTHLDYFIADSPVECHRDQLRVGSRAVTALSMKEPPSRTYAHMLADLLRVPCDLWRVSVAAAFEREDSQDIHARRRHFFNKRVSIVNYAAPERTQRRCW